MEEVDEGIAKLQQEGWEFISVSTCMTTGVWVLVVVRRDVGS